MFMSRLGVLYNSILSLISGGLGDSFYRLILSFMLICFLSLRVPYLYGVCGFALFLISLILPIFLGLVLSRVLVDGFSSFFCGFVPVGTPLWIAPFVCLVETLSYVVRPLVLVLRPFVNLTIGALGVGALGCMVFKFSYWILLFMGVAFFYEVFVALVHWFIVCIILSFSEKH